MDKDSDKPAPATWRDRLREDRDFLFPVLLVIVFLAALSWLHVALGLGGLKLETANDLHMEFGVAWGVAELLLLVSLFSALGYCVYTIRAECQDPPELSYWRPVMLVLVISAAIIFSLSRSPVGGGLTKLLLEGLQNDKVDWTVTIGNYVGAVLLVGTATSVSLIAMFRGPATVPVLAAKVRRFGASLWLSAAVIVFALLEIYLLFRWGVAVLATTENEQQLNRLMTSLSLGAGAVGTALLIVIFAPTAFALDGALGDLKARHYSAFSSDKEMAVWLGVHGLDSSPVKSVWTLLAVFGPIISGVAQSVFTKVLGAG